MSTYGEHHIDQSVESVLSIASAARQKFHDDPALIFFGEAGNSLNPDIIAALRVHDETEQPIEAKLAGLINLLLEEPLVRGYSIGFVEHPGDWHGAEEMQRGILDVAKERNMIITDLSHPIENTANPQLILRYRSEAIDKDSVTVSRRSVLAQDGVSIRMREYFKIPKPKDRLGSDGFRALQEWSKMILWIQLADAELERSPLDEALAEELHNARYLAEKLQKVATVYSEGIYLSKDSRGIPAVTDFYVHNRLPDYSAIKAEATSS